jgi:hypothetical protein
MGSSQRFSVGSSHLPLFEVVMGKNSDEEKFPLLVVSRNDLIEAIQNSSSVIEYTIELITLLDALRPLIPKGDYSDYFKRIDIEGARIMSASKRLSKNTAKLIKDCH